MTPETLTTFEEVGLPLHARHAVGNNDNNDDLSWFTKAWSFSQVITHARSHGLERIVPYLLAHSPTDWLADRPDCF